MTASQGADLMAPNPGDVSSASGASQSFGDRLAQLVQQRQSQLVLGLDPDPARLWPRATEQARAGVDEPVALKAARAVFEHCRLAIDSAGRECVAVKFQVACFERLGGPGWDCLSAGIRYARQAGLLVIADAKRGDVSMSAAAYAQAFFGVTPTAFGEVQGLGADALTANPLLGVDALDPLLESARRVGAGLLVLVRTSNPGAEDVQEVQLAAGGSLSEHLAGLVDRLGRPGLGESGLSDVGAVVGATAPARLVRMRELMPHATFLLPGVGAQGGRVEDLAAAFAPGRGGGLVSASRSIVFAHEHDGGDPQASAQREAARLRELAWSVSG